MPNTSSWWTQPLTWQQFHEAALERASRAHVTGLMLNEYVVGIHEPTREAAHSTRRVFGEPWVSKRRQGAKG